jgi:hypothetical protein|tara:strand:+ start:306 stop:539 length:234 start_codon:yes stop_codon:yes gene_type:complete
LNLGFLFLFFEDLFVDFFTLFTKIFNAFDELVVVVLEGGALGSLSIMRKKTVGTVKPVFAKTEWKNKREGRKRVKGR